MTDNIHLVTFGSINVDRRIDVASFPIAGETAHARNIDDQVSLGGKGANQAAAAALLGARVTLVSAVGDDAEGRTALRGLADIGVDISGVVQRAVSTGQAFVFLREDGENSIIVQAGANRDVRGSDASDDLLRQADALLAQLEVPAASVLDVFRRARDSGIRTILNAAPAPAEWTRDVQQLIAATDVLIVNEGEAQQLATIADVHERADGEAAAQLATLGPRAVIVTRGANGITAYANGELVSVPAYASHVVDTTGAGDATTAGIAVTLMRHGSIDDALRYGAAAGAVAVRRRGTVAAYGCDADVRSVVQAVQYTA